MKWKNETSNTKNGTELEFTISHTRNVLKKEHLKYFTMFCNHPAAAKKQTNTTETVFMFD